MARDGGHRVMAAERWRSMRPIERRTEHCRRAYGLGACWKRPVEVASRLASVNARAAT